MTKEQAEEIVKLYWAREKELYKERKNIIKCAYAQLAEYHDDLWF